MQWFFGIFLIRYISTVHLLRCRDTFGNANFQLKVFKLLCFIRNKNIYDYLLPTIKLAFAILTFELTSLSPQNSINLTGAKENSWVRGVTSLRTRDNRENQNLKERSDTVDSLLIPTTTDSFLCCLCVLQH